MTKELFFWPSDWLDSCRKCSPPTIAPSVKLTMQMTSEISAMESTVDTEAVTSLRRKSAALAHMIKSANNQMAKENVLPSRITDCAFCGNWLTRRARSSGTNMVTSTGFSTCQTEICTTSPTTNGSVAGKMNDMTILLNRTAPTTYSTCPSIKLIMTGAAIAVGAIPVIKAANARFTLKGCR